jgi:hypothetical protein
MKSYRIIIQTLCLGIIISTTSCASLWYKDDWAKITDKKFILGKVTIFVDNTKEIPDYGYLKYDKPSVLEKNFRTMPLKEIFAPVEKRYGIEIDFSEFEAANKKEDMLEYISGGYSWESSKKNPNPRDRSLPKNHIAMEIRFKTCVWSSEALSSYVSDARFFSNFVATIDSGYSIKIYSGGLKGDITVNYPDIIHNRQRPDASGPFIQAKQDTQNEYIIGVKKDDTIKKSKSDLIIIADSGGMEKYLAEKLFGENLIKMTSSLPALGDDPKKLDKDAAEKKKSEESKKKAEKDNADAAQKKADDAKKEAEKKKKK